MPGAVESGFNQVPTSDACAILSREMATAASLVHLRLAKTHSCSPAAGSSCIY
jgi:hypothetical protein